MIKQGLRIYAYGAAYTGGVFACAHALRMVFHEHERTWDRALLTPAIALTWPVSVPLMAIAAVDQTITGAKYKLVLTRASGTRDHWVAHTIETTDKQ